MAILKSEGIVLRGWRLGETSRILSIFTREFGKIKVVAKGALGPKSKFKGCVESLAHVDLIYYDKRTRELQLLSQADLKDGHVRILGNAARTSLALASCELLDRAVLAEEPNLPLFDMTVRYLRAMNGSDGFLEGHFWYYEGRFIELMGYQPTWDRCLDCGGSLGAGGGFFLPANGGLLCRECGSRRGGLRIEGETLEVLFWLQGTDLEEAGRLKPPPGQKAEIRKMFDLYFKTHIEHMKPLKSLAVYYGLEG
jgi:DNA repair protein RecO (recombination protein O)